MTSHGIDTEVSNGIAIWTLNRPDRMNALGRATVRELGRLARTLSSDVRAVIVTGAGARAFCAGADLKERQTMNEQDVRDFLPLYRESFGEIERLRVPTIAVINGVAFGGGLELALACDMRIMSNDTQIGLTETSLGIIPGAGGTQRLTRLVGVAKATELVVLAKRIDAEEALRLGIVNQISQSPLNDAKNWATTIAKGAPIAISAALEAVRAASDSSLEEGLTIERNCYERTLQSTDRLEALAAFKEKRAPQFRGQ